MTPDITFVLGTRPEIIKLAPLIRACKEANVPFTLVHTGQHYSECLDDVFFNDLEIPRPDHTLNVGSASHGKQTGQMVVGVENILIEEQPDVVIVQGDTNSALAGGIAASKLNCELAHVEAGLRSFDRNMPEEVNRKLLDHISDWLFAPTSEAAQQLRQESIPDDCITVTGNTIVDAVLENLELAETKSTVLDELDLEEGKFALLTAHRAGNVDDKEEFADLLEGVGTYAERAQIDVVYPIHPHSADNLNEFALSLPDRVRTVEPLRFIDFLRLEDAASIVFTDSGGVQEETCVIGTPCVTLRENTERPETLTVGSNVLVGTDPNKIVAAAIQAATGENDWQIPFGDGTAASQILEQLGVESPTVTDAASEPSRVLQ